MAHGNDRFDYGTATAQRGWHCERLSLSGHDLIPIGWEGEDFAFLRGMKGFSVFGTLFCAQLFVPYAGTMFPSSANRSLQLQPSKGLKSVWPRFVRCRGHFTAMEFEMLKLCLMTGSRRGTLPARGAMVLLAIASLVCSVDSTLAQNAGFGDSPQGANPSAVGGFGANQNMVTQFRGKLKGFQRGVVLVQKEDGTDVMVQMPENISSFQFVALAKPAFLQRGQLVRLSGTFNPVNGMAVTPINKVELFQPVNGKLTGGTREQYVPGVYPEKRGENPQAFAEPIHCRVVGGVMGLNANGLLAVQAGGRPLQIPLAQDATFEIRYNNLSLAQEGDEVSVSGFYQPPDETRIRAERITITTDRVYGEFSEEPPKRNSRRRPTRDAAGEEKETAEKEAAEKEAGDEAKKIDPDQPEAEGVAKPE